MYDTEFFSPVRVAVQKSVYVHCYKVCGLWGDVQLKASILCPVPIDSVNLM